MNDIADYLLVEDFWHAPVAGWLWWSWNPNSADTGGVVRPQSSAWPAQFEAHAMKLLQAPTRVQVTFGHTFSHAAQVEDDWASISWEKVDYMTRIGLRPWCPPPAPAAFGH